MHTLLTLSDHSHSQSSSRAGNTTMWQGYCALSTATARTPAKPPGVSGVNLLLRGVVLLQTSASNKLNTPRRWLYAYCDLYWFNKLGMRHWVTSGSGDLLIVALATWRPAQATKESINYCETLPGDDYMRTMTYIASINCDFVKSWLNRYRRIKAKLFNSCLLEEELLKNEEPWSHHGLTSLTYRTFFFVKKNNIKFVCIDWVL